VVAKDGIGMKINKHYKSCKFNPVMGGSQLAFKGGWATGTAGIPSRRVSAHVFVLADVWGGFGQLVFGRRRSTAVDRAKIRCITGLQAELRNAVDSDAPVVAAVGAPVEEDLMGDAAMARGLEDNPGRSKLSRTGRRLLAKKKKAVRQRPAEGRVVAVRFPKYPGTAVGESVVNVTCLLETCKQRPKGVWLRKEDFPWLVTYAAMEVANADGEELFPPRPAAVAAADRTCSLTYNVGMSAWDLTWIDSGGAIHHLTQAVPRKRYGRGGVAEVIPAGELLDVKERTRLKLLREARARGYDDDGDGMSHPQTA